MLGFARRMEPRLDDVEINTVLDRTIEIGENVRGMDVFAFQPTCQPANTHLMELLIMIDALKHASARRITAVMPYFPYARSDKKDRPRISITARLIADLLETAGADRVLIKPAPLATLLAEISALLLGSANK